MKQLELGIAGGREMGSAKEGHCYGWLCTSVCSFFFLEGDQMQWARQIERLMALSFVFQRHVECLVYD